MSTLVCFRCGERRGCNCGDKVLERARERGVQEFVVASGRKRVPSVACW